MYVAPDLEPPPLRLLSRAEADDYRQEHAAVLPPLREAEEASRHAHAMLKLPRGSRLLPTGVPGPMVGFTHTEAGQRFYVIVCRDRGDIEWPAWVRYQRKQARGIGAALVKRAFGPLMDQLDDMRAASWWEGKDPATLTGDQAAAYYAAMANKQAANA